MIETFVPFNLRLKGPVKNRVGVRRGNRPEALLLNKHVRSVSFGVKLIQSLLLNGTIDIMESYVPWRPPLHSVWLSLAVVCWCWGQ